MVFVFNLGYLPIILYCYFLLQSPESPLPKPPLIVNEYETITPASPTEVMGDNMPLFRITSDGPSPQLSQEQSSDQAAPVPTTPPPVPEKGADLASGPHIHCRVETDSTTVVYSDTVATKLSTAPPPTAAEDVVYHEIEGYQNPKVYHTHLYALPSATPFNPPKRRHSFAVHVASYQGLNSHVFQCTHKKSVDYM